MKNALFWIGLSILLLTACTNKQLRVLSDGNNFPKGFNAVRWKADMQPPKLTDLLYDNSLLRYHIKSEVEANLADRGIYFDESADVTVEFFIITERREAVNMLEQNNEGVDNPSAYHTAVFPYVKATLSLHFEDSYRQQSLWIGSYGTYITENPESLEKTYQEAVKKILKAFPIHNNFPQ